MNKKWKTLAVILFLVALAAFCILLPDRTPGSAETTGDTSRTETTACTTTTSAVTIAPETSVTVTTVPETLTEEPSSYDFVNAAEYVPNLWVDLVYATAENFTGVEIYDFNTCCLRYSTAQKLADAAEQFALMGYGILIWDGFRPTYAQEKLWNICPDPAYVSKPGTGSQSHCRGIAVDITLYSLETGELLEMPSGFDEFSKRADRDYSDCSQTAADNATALEKIMILCGFKPYSGEWWHYADTDSYPIETEFDPSDMN